MDQKKELNQIFNEYKTLYSKKFEEIDKTRIEVATFGISNTPNEIRRIGLGLITIVNHKIEVQKTDIGHTGKILLSLPEQFMPEHKHVDILIMPKDILSVGGYTRIEENVKNFKGIKKYDESGKPQEDSNGQEIYRYHKDDYKIFESNIKSQLTDDQKQKMIHYIEGKSETFKMVYGGGVLFSDDAIILNETLPIPKEMENAVKKILSNQTITTKNAIYLNEGSEILLPKNTKHSFLGGPQGAVFIEFSTPSLDEADVFTDKRIIR